MKTKVVGVTVFEEDALVQPAVFLSHEPVPDHLHTITTLHPHLVLPYNPHSRASR
jgi:hypothetical protein